MKNFPDHTINLDGSTFYAAFEGCDIYLWDGNDAGFYLAMTGNSNYTSVDYRDGLRHRNGEPRISATGSGGYRIQAPDSVIDYIKALHNLRS